MRTRSRVLNGTGALGLYQIRGDLFAKVSLFLLVAQLIATARMASEFKAVPAAQAASGPKPSLTLFLDTDGSFHTEPPGGNQSASADLPVVISNAVRNAQGQTLTVALCLPDRNPLAKALVEAGLSVARLATNSEILVALGGSRTNYELVHK